MAGEPIMSATGHVNGRSEETGSMRGEARVRVRAGIAALVLACGSAGGTATAAPDALATIKELVAQGQFQRAYEQATASEARYEGDPEFDFYYGMAALESGYFPEAIFAFERVVFAQPGNLRVRLELGRAHFLAGNYAAAEAEFQRVLTRDPPQTVRANIRTFLERIEIARRQQRRELGGWVDARLGNDSNINSATSDGTIDTPLGNFDLVQDGREQDDDFVRFELGGAWKEPLTKDSNLDVSARWQQKDNRSTDAFDLGVGVIEAGYGRTVENGRYRIGVRLQNVTLDNDRFQNGYGLTGSWDLSIAQNWILSLTGAITALRYADDHVRDTDQFLGSATLIRPQGNFMHTLSVYGAVEPARDDDRGEHNGRNFFGALYGVQYLSDDWQPYLRLGIQDVGHVEDHPVFAKEREDLTLTAALGARYSLMDSLQLTAEASWTDVDSNLGIFEYERFLVEAGLRVTF
jgi:tetratricopeptide (TPR) repeat protein